jgi:hypothetical protein
LICDFRSRGAALRKRRDVLDASCIALYSGKAEIACRLNLLSEIQGDFQRRDAGTMIADVEVDQHGKRDPAAPSHLIE